jgi:hypothetical protein
MIYDLNRIATEGSAQDLVLIILITLKVLLISRYLYITY